MRRKKSKQPKPAKPAKMCLCSPRQKPYFPISAHTAGCPVSKSFTANGRVIADMMHSEKMRGNVRDYVVLSGNTLIDFHGTFDMRKDGGKLSVPKVCIVHKRNLYKFVGYEQAERFWKPGFGRVLNAG